MDEREVADGVSQGSWGTTRRRNQQLRQASASPNVTVTAESSVGRHFLGYVRVERQKSVATVEVSQLQATEGRVWAAHAPATGNVKINNSVHSEAHVPDGSSDASWIHGHGPHPSKLDMGYEVRRPRDAQDEAGLWGQYRDDPLHLRHPGS